MAIPTKNQPIKAKGQTTPVNATGHAETTSKNAAPAHELVRESPSQFPLARRNFIFMTAAGLLIVIGFLLMLGGGSSPEKFNPDIFSTRRIIIGPTLAFLGFVAMGIAIIVKPAKKADAGNGTDSDTAAD